MFKLSRFNWVTTNVVFGVGCFDNLANDLGRHVPDTQGPLIIFCGRNSMQKLGHLDSLIKQFAPRDAVVFEGISSNPSLSDCEKATEFLKSVKDAAMLFAIGGGSVIDTAKIANIAAAVDGSIREIAFLASNQIITRRIDNFVAIPTTAGTGSEVTPYATAWDFESPQKYSVTSSACLPAYVYLDPLLTVSLPKSVTLATAGDALGHAMESIWSKSNNHLSEALASRAILLIVNTLAALLEDTSCIEKRSRMLWASLLAGMSISITRTAAAHAISYPLTLRYSIPHGQAVAAILPYVLAANLHVLDPEQVSLLCRSFGISERTDLVAACSDFLERTGIKMPLKRFGVKLSDIDTIAASSYTPGRIDNNIHDLSLEDIKNIIQAAL